MSNGGLPVSDQLISGEGLPLQTDPPPVGSAAVGNGSIVTTTPSDNVLSQLVGFTPIVFT